MTRDEELADLRSKLRKRQGRAGYAENVKALETRIAELEAQDD